MSSNTGTSSSTNAVSAESVPIRKVVATKVGQFLLLGTKSLPSIPLPVPDPLLGFPHNPKIYLARTWSLNSIPYQAFVPADTHAACQCQLLHSLNYTQGSVPVEMKGQKWYLHDDVHNEWRDLEMALLRLRELLQSATTDVYPRSPWFSWPKPRRYSYAGGDTNQSRLASKITNSRAAFMLVIAEITYHAACQPNFWDEVIYKHFGRHMTDLLKESWMACDREGYDLLQAKDGSTHQLERLGFFVDADRCLFPRALPAMIRAHIPLWIIWGKCLTLGEVERGLESYRPTEREVWEAEPWALVTLLPPPPPPLRIPLGLRDDGGSGVGLSDWGTGHDVALEPIHVREEPWHHGDHSCRQSTPPMFQDEGSWPGASGWGHDVALEPIQVQWTALMDDSVPVQGPKIQHEPIEKGEIPNGQRLRETWQDFFACREAKNALRLEKESEQSRQTQLQKELHAHQFKVPGSKGTHVQVEDVWWDYGDSQCRYDGFHNEWDLNWEFDPNAPDEDGDLIDQLYGNLDSAVSEAAAQIDHVDRPEVCIRSNEEQLLTWEELGQRLSGCDEASLVPERVYCQTLERVLSHYHGIRVPPSRESPLTPVQAKKANNCLRALSCRNAFRSDKQERVTDQSLADCLDGLVNCSSSIRLPVE
ncbi:hypothetical protein F5146DRAFT_1129523 [Armillaria mellea]|nr:hypothetical protein F5146DRAFT_1129523 [Armillaria mellea]